MSSCLRTLRGRVHRGSLGSPTAPNRAPAGAGRGTSLSLCFSSSPSIASVSAVGHGQSCGWLLPRRRLATLWSLRDKAKTRRRGRGLDSPEPKGMASCHNSARFGLPFGSFGAANCADMRLKWGIRGWNPKSPSPRASLLTCSPKYYPAHGDVRLDKVQMVAFL